MNRVKHLAVIFLIFVMCFGMCVPVYATTLELMTQKLNAYDGNICTVKYYSPDSTYTNAIIIGNRSVSYGGIDRWHLIFYKDGTTFTYLGNYNAWSASEDVYYKTYTKYDDAVKALFENTEATDYSTVKQFANFTYGAIYLYQEDAYYDEAAQSMEAAYYDWYVETYGEEPKFESVDVGGDNSENSAGIISKLQEVIDAILSIANPNPDYDFLVDMNNKLANKLEDNGFYTSITKIQRELSSIYNQNYMDPAGFHEINPAKLTLRRGVIATDDGGSYTYSKIDWGLDNVSVIGDMKWFFGTHYNTGKVGRFINVDGTPAVKHYSDALISAFLWIGFAFMLWQRLPSIISGDLATMTATTSDVISTATAGSRTMEDMYRTTKVDMGTGEVISDTMTTKRRVK